MDQVATGAAPGESTSGPDPDTGATGQNTGGPDPDTGAPGRSTSGLDRDTGATGQNTGGPDLDTSAPGRSTSGLDRDTCAPGQSTGGPELDTPCSRPVRRSGGRKDPCRAPPHRFLRGGSHLIVPANCRRPGETSSRLSMREVAITDRSYVGMLDLWQSMTQNRRAEAVLRGGPTGESSFSFRLSSEWG